MFIADLRSRQLKDLSRFAEAVRYIGVFYNGFVFTGAVTVFLAGLWIILVYDYPVLSQPWLLGMIILFGFEFVEGNSITRIYFNDLSKKCTLALEQGLDKAPELEEHRGPWLATFTHYLDLPLFFTIVSLGVLRPTTWSQCIVGVLISITLATCLTLLVPRLWPWPELVDDLGPRG